MMADSSDDEIYELCSSTSYRLTHTDQLVASENVISRLDDPFLIMGHEQNNVHAWSVMFCFHFLFTNKWRYRL